VCGGLFIDQHRVDGVEGEGGPDECKGPELHRRDGFVKNEESTGIPHDRPEFLGAFLDGQQGKQEKEGSDDGVQNDFECRDGVQSLPVNRAQPPDEEG
jgi:hypothetical protein